MSERCEIAIVGAGAAGLTAAIFAAESAHDAGRPVRIALLDGAEKIGTKLLISGGGRCNVTHDEVRAEDFNGSRNIIRQVLAAFDATATVRWFASLGVQLKREETGKLFPVSDRSRTVLDALLARCRELDVDVRSGHRVREVRVVLRTVEVCDRAARLDAEPDSFVLLHGAPLQGELRADRVIMATGGCSLPRTGSDGGGWEVARLLGHTVTHTFPALVPLVMDERFFHAALSGLSHSAELSTSVGGKLIDRRRGSLLWTHFGISGPVAMDASRHWLIAKHDAEPGVLVELRCSFLPGQSFERAERSLIERAAQSPRMLVTRAIAGEIPERLAIALARHAGIDPAVRLGQLTRERRRTLIHALTALPLPVVRDRGWDYAEATAGGVPLREIDFRTMQSRTIPGLYLTGEMLDCDGRIGGFNFQWAWSTGYLAGRAAGRGSRQS